jgi:microcystin-dependent protein
LLPISQYAALYSLLGTYYGGDGKATFALPDLRGRVPVPVGAGKYALGQKAGQEKIALIAAETPAHTHPISASEAGSRSGVASPAGAVPVGGCGQNIYTKPPDQTIMAHEMIVSAGGAGSHENRQPSLGINFIIAYSGLYPVRP